MTTLIKKKIESVLMTAVESNRKQRLVKTVVIQENWSSATTAVSMIE